MAEKQDKMYVLYVSICILLNISVASTGGSVNISKLYNIYSAVCGNSFCDTRHIPNGVDVKNYFSHSKVCPECFCDKQCIVHGNCCPDIFFSSNKSCIDQAILLENPFKHANQRILTISICPPDYKNRGKRKLCEKGFGMEERVKSVPVTYVETNQTYKNIYCAQCSNESAESLLHWQLETECARSADFNFLSSFKAVIDFAKDKSCSLFYSEKNISITTKFCNITPDDVINACNVTGTWRQYDEDIEYACNTYENRYYSFKNVYCFLCNPPRTIEKVITKCNITRMWFPYNSKLKDACLETNETGVTGRYKNVYCFLCNRNNLKPEFFKMKVTKSSFFKESKRFSFEFKTSILTLDYKILAGNTINRKTNLNIAMDISTAVPTVYAPTMDRLNVLKHYYTYTGKADFCHNYSYFDVLNRCKCNDDCHFQTSGCCIDKYFEKTLFCTEKEHSKNGNRYLVNAPSCENMEDPILNRLCMENDEDHLFSFLPVKIETTDEHKEHYKNIYCALCNKNTTSIAMVTPLKLVSECDINIPPLYHMSFSEYFSFSKENNCSFYYDDDYGRDNIIKCKNHHSKCNETGLWQQYDSDIKETCEKFIFPNDQVCSICNPENESSSSLGGHGYKRPTGNGGIASYRIIFSISNFHEDSKNDVIQVQCSENQVLNPITNDCRNVMCYPGRMLVMNECVPLFPVTSNLGYILTLSLETELTSIIYKPLEYLKTIQSSFENFVSNLLLQPVLETESLHFVSNLTCSENDVWVNGTRIHISIYFNFFIISEVNRTFVEDILLSIQGSFYNITYIDNVYIFVITYDEHAVNLPSLVSKLKFTGKCLSSSTTTNSTNAHMYKHSHVNQLLGCKQIELTEKEYKLDVQWLKVTVLFTGTELSYDQFMQMSSGKVRMCVETFKKLFLKKNIIETTFTAWDIFQIICTCLSLLCLLCTFVTYSLFPNLRSLPGKNNMSLVFAMFCTHFIFQFIILGKKSDVGCRIIGILLHYFLLVTFCCLNICSFHMFRVFTSETGIHLSGNCEFIKYLIYSYIFPAVIIGLNIVTATIKSDHTSIGYGGHLCFLNNSVAFIVTFILPLGLICLTNIFFFTATSVKIARRPKITDVAKMQPTKMQVIVYIKLFTITGITWLLQIIDTFLPSSVFSIIISLLNTLQGVFIFLSYVCNKRVFDLYTKTKKCVYQTQSDPSTRTTNTSV